MKKRRRFCNLYFYTLIILNLVLTSQTKISSAQSPPVEGKSAEPIVSPSEIYEVGEPIYFTESQTKSRSAPANKIQSYPNDPTADIPWSCGAASVTDVACAFNAARKAENTQLGKSLPMLFLPDQGEWDNMSDGEKAIWLINRERIDRGIAPLHGLETNVAQVAQYYAQYLIDNDAWGHYEDGRSPWKRLADNPSIGACHDFLNVAENLAGFWTSGTYIPLPVERAIYIWMYDDAGSSWGHRHAILWYPYKDNSGPGGKEGFLGIGRASGPHYGGNFAEMIVMNVFDPCPIWNYPSENIIALPRILLLLLSN